jgi:hypothetical protein
VKRRCDSVSPLHPEWVRERSLRFDSGSFSHSATLPQIGSSAGTGWNAGLDARVGGRNEVSMTLAVGRQEGWGDFPAPGLHPGLV